MIVEKIFNQKKKKLKLMSQKEISFTKEENDSIEQYFKKQNQLPIHFQFRAKVIFSSGTYKNAIVALSSLYIGCFVSKKGKIQLINPDSFIHILNVDSIEVKSNFVNLRIKNFNQEEAYSELIFRGSKCQRFAQLFYRNYSFTFSKKLDIKADWELFPDIEFARAQASDIIISPSQRFQFSFYSYSALSCIKYYHPIVQYVHSLISSRTTILDISELIFKIEMVCQNDEEKSTIIQIFLKALRNFELINGYFLKNYSIPNILAFILENPNLTFVHLENCGIKEGFKNFSEKKLKIKYWNLSNNQEIPSKEISYFSKIIQNSEVPILYLNLGYCKISAENSNLIFKALKNNKKMHEIEFLTYSGNFLNSDECQKSFISFLEEISKKDPKLRYVDFSSMTYEELEMILTNLQAFKLPIETLILKDCTLDMSCKNELLKLISKSECLKELDLSYMQNATNSFLFEVIYLINNNEKISQIKLSLNGIDIKNVLYPRMCFLNKNKKSLYKWKSLSFNDCKITPENLQGLEVLLAELPNLTELSLNSNFDCSMIDIGEELRNLLCNLPNLEKLSISDNNLKSSIFPFLNYIIRKSCNLVYLDISNNNIGNEILYPLKSIIGNLNSKLQSIFFDGNKISDIFKLEELVKSSLKSSSLITFPFPINDVKNIIDKSYGPERQHVIYRLSSIQQIFVNATKSRKCLPFLKSEESIISDLATDITRDVHNFPSDYFYHHTKFCDVFNLPLPFLNEIKNADQMNKLKIGSTDIGSMKIYEQRNSDYPRFDKDEDSEAIIPTLSLYYEEENDNNNEESNPKGNKKTKTKEKENKSDENEEISKDEEDKDQKKSKNKKKKSSTEQVKYFIDNEDEEYHIILRKIGEGGTSITYQIFDTRTRQIMCKKVLKNEEEEGKFNFKDVQNAMKEFEVLYNLDHPCICRAIGINTSEPVDSNADKDMTTVALFLEYFEIKLKDCLDKNVLSNTMKVKIVVEIAQAMSYIHQKGLIHRDLKVDNIMIDSQWNIKLIDFGLVSIDQFLNSNYSLIAKSMTKGVGTLAFMSPEMLNEEDYDEKTDVYSFGIVLFYIFFGNLPNYTMKDKMIGKPIRLPKPSAKISIFCLDLISKCTENDPSDRPSFNQILKIIRKNDYCLADDIDQSMISERDQELERIKSK